MPSQGSILASPNELPYTTRHISPWYGMTVRSYAKINLGLRILRKRSDGYHDLETVFHRINLWDDIVLRPTPGTLRLETDRADLPADSSNLCLRAAELLKAKAPAGAGVSISLRKHIPVGAGLGGGSSDAASVLLGLKHLWSMRMSDDELRSMALRLGSDVPYFLGHGSAYATGRGERLELIPLVLPYWIVVVVPPVHISTAWAYQHLRLSDRPPQRSLKDIVLRPLPELQDSLAQLSNDFEPLVLESHADIREAKNRLSGSGAACALMSGTGSAVFALFADEDSARRAAKAVGAEGQALSLTEPGFSPPVPHIIPD